MRGRRGGGERPRNTQRSSTRPRRYPTHTQARARSLSLLSISLPHTRTRLLLVQELPRHRSELGRRDAHLFAAFADLLQTFTTLFQRPHRFVHRLGRSLNRCGRLSSAIRLAREQLLTRRVAAHAAARTATGTHATGQRIRPRHAATGTGTGTATGPFFGHALFVSLLLATQTRQRDAPLLVLEAQAVEARVTGTFGVIFLRRRCGR